VTAAKPGNVHRRRDFADLHFAEFVLSAGVIGPAIDLARREGVGRSILAAIEATRRVVSTNTNLGMVLLLAPLAAVPPDVSLETGIVDILDACTLDDTRLVYQAIRLAQPGGLGRTDEEDVSGEPSKPLRAAMVLAADRDLVARQYASGYHEVLQKGLPVLRRSLDQGTSLEIAIITTHLSLLSGLPDSLIARKRGAAIANEVSRRAADVLDAGWPDHPESQMALARFDNWLSKRTDRLNPGTTADLVTAALFAALRDGTIRLPLVATA
jgi:triphosphoribosyl-dephospho-CoA synthase